MVVKTNDTTALHVLLGPTASGKGEIARRVAGSLGAEILVIDSMKVFRGLEISTAKPSQKARRAVPHHLIDVADPTEPFSVVEWLPLCEAAIADVTARGRVPLLVCGTPFYLRSLLYGLFEGPPPRWDLRDQLLAEARRAGEGVLHERLRKVDPRSAERLHPHDVRRVVRALEVFEATGRPLSLLQATRTPRPEWRTRLVGILWPRADLHDRITVRVEHMLAAGLVDEVRRLRSGSRPLGRQAAQAVGVKEVVEQLEARLDEEETAALIARNTRRLARHQMTWFRKFPGVEWVEASAGTYPERVAESIGHALAVSP